MEEGSGRPHTPEPSQAQPLGQVRLALAPRRLALDDAAAGLGPSGVHVGAAHTVYEVSHGVPHSQGAVPAPRDVEAESQVRTVAPVVEVGVPVGAVAGVGVARRKVKADRPLTDEPFLRPASECGRGPARDNRERSP